ncbi:MAG: M23 family metallopeptidase [Bacteroidales bacterium]|nr:M23 family metallopeptidase [Bacteroidales bacterium]
MKKEKKKKKKWYYKLRDKYRLVIMNEETYEEKLSFRLSRLNVFIVLGTIAILLIVLTIYLIAFTTLREYIPGYTDITLQKKVYDLQLKTDSIENDLRQKNLYINNIKNIIEGREIIDQIPDTPEPNINYKNITINKSYEDSVFRVEFEEQNNYDLYYNENEELFAQSSLLSTYNFFIPLKGLITNEFNLTVKHYGVDIVAKRNEAVKATLDGTVIFSDWTVETGNVICIQHQRNFISVYKHNASLLKKAGSIVKAGEPIAIVGESGELSTGPHLHFELWYNGTPVNPQDYMAF